MSVGVSALRNALIHLSEALITPELPGCCLRALNLLRDEYFMPPLDENGQEVKGADK